MRDPYRNPKLRWPLDVGNDQIEGESIVYLRCPLGITASPLVLKAAVAPVLARFDGTRNVDQILAEFQEAGLTAAILQELIQLLELHFFLDSPRFYAEQQAIRDRFTASSVREPMMAGAGYAKNRDELVRELERYMGSELEPETEPADPLVALVVPHIDYRRGSHGYGQTYKKLRNQNHEVYLLLGTAHQYSPHLFHLTTKDFETPLGTLKNKRSVVETLAHSYGVERSFADEFLHKREHSLELQTPFLAHLQPQAEIIPILVGSLHQCIRKNTYPEELEIYESFVGELASITRAIVQAGSSLCIIGGVDMAHVGRSFGDPGALSPQSMEAIAERDHQYLQAISARDKHALFDHIAEDGDARRICGYPSLYVMLDLLERLEVPYEVEQDYYHQAVDYRNDCAVTFAGLSFYERKLPHDAIHGNP